MASLCLNLLHGPTKFMNVFDDRFSCCDMVLMLLFLAKDTWLKMSYSCSIIYY